MKKRFSPAIAAIVLMFCLSVVRADDWDKPAADPDGSVALASQFEALAHQILRYGRGPQATWTMSAALFRAASRLDPKEPRYLRSLADDLLDANDIPGAIKALSDYRKLDPDNCGAQIQQIDLYLGQMQSADKKLTYLDSLLKRQMIPAQVRSEIAVRSAQLSIAQSNTAAALKMLSTALVFNPINLSAARFKYQLTQNSGLPLEHAVQLLTMLRANPADANAASHLASLLADQGLTQLSVIWYSYANSLYLREQMLPDQQFGRGAASELVIAGRNDDAINLLAQYLAAYPNDPDGWFIDLAAAKLSADQNKDNHNIQAAYADLQKRAGNALMNDLMQARMAAGDSTATTRPIDSDPASLPDLSGDPLRLRKTGQLDLAELYVSAASSLAWFDLYFRQDAQGADPLIQVLGKLLDTSDPLFVRLRGWQQYVAQDYPSAIKTLTPIAKSQPYADLALVLIDLQTPGKHKQAQDRAQTLMDAHPSGVIGAILWTELGALRISVDPSPQSDAVATVVSNIPRNFMQMVDQPQSFYLIDADPIRDSYQFGEPVLVRLTVRNISAAPLAIGPECALRPDFWFDAYFRGAFDLGMMGVAVTRLDDKLVLLPGQSSSSIVRVDQDALYDIFNQAPSLDMTMNLMVTSNPMAVQQSGQSQTARPGPCGFRAQLTRLIERVPLPISTPDDRANLQAQLNSGDGGQSIRALSTMAAYVITMRTKNIADPDNVSDSFLQQLHKAATNASLSPAVVDWAKVMAGSCASDVDRPMVTTNLIHDSDWQTRLLAAVMAPPSQRKEVAQALSNDPDSTVRDFAQAQLLYLAATANQPTTQPAQP